MKKFTAAVQQLARWCNGQGCGAPSPRRRGSILSYRPRVLLSWFQSGREGLGTCNRFEELNKYLLTAYFEVIQEYFFREVTFSIFDQSDSEKDDVTMVKKI